MSITLFLLLGVLIFSLAIHKIPLSQFRKIRLFRAEPQIVSKDNSRTNFVAGSDNNSENGSRNILRKLTVEQKVGQLFLIGFEGKEMTPALENYIKRTHPGGVLLLKRNIESSKQLKLRKLIKDLQEIAKRDTGLPLFIAIDQEGGEICRLGFLNCIGQPEIKNEEQAFETGFKRGRELKDFGVNLNLAPVLDQGQEGDFIFRRTFQKRSEEAGNLAKSLILGQKKAGIFTAIKHFPGYGGINFNPETQGLAVFSKIPEISQFLKAMEAKPEIVMMANAVYTEISPVRSKLPEATAVPPLAERTSNRVSRDPIPVSAEGTAFLKEKLGKEILIISDDLSSPVLKQEFSLEKTIVSAKKAGIDILLVSGFWDSADPEKAYNALLEAAQEGKISQEKIDRTILKIIRLKQKLTP